MKFLLYGHLTLDINSKGKMIYQGPGGSVYFAAQFLKNMGIKPLVISVYGADFPNKWVNDSLIYPSQPQQLYTMLFKNSYSTSGQRKQNVQYHHHALLPKVDEYRKLIKKIDAVMVAPLLSNIDTSEIIELLNTTVKSLHVLSPQGFFRKVTKKGQVIYKNCQEIDKIISLFDIVVLSQEDCPQVDKKAYQWSKNGPMIIVTKGKGGCIIYYQDSIIAYPAFNVDNIVDETGAGDIFTAAFAYAYLQSKNIKKSAVFANAAAGLSLRNLSDELKYSYRDVVRFAQSQNVNIKI